MKLRMALRLPCCAWRWLLFRRAVFYDDGPINGTVDAWTINYGYIVSDTFVAPHNTTVTGFMFGAW